MASRVKSLFQNLKRYAKAPWNFTGPQSGPEFKHSLPKATDYRVFCPATAPAKAIVPSSNPETVYDIKYFSRDQRRNRPPIKRTILKKDDIAKMMTEQTFHVKDFPQPYLTAMVEEDYNAIGEAIKNEAVRLVRVKTLLADNKVCSKHSALISGAVYYALAACCLLFQFNCGFP